MITEFEKDRADAACRDAVMAVFEDGSIELLGETAKEKLKQAFEAIGVTNVSNNNSANKYGVCKLSGASK